MKRKRIVGIIVLMLSLAVFCLAACQPQTREVEAVEPEPTTLAQSGSTERDPGFFPRGRLYDKLYQCWESRLRVLPRRRFVLARFRVSAASALQRSGNLWAGDEGHRLHDVPSAAKLSVAAP